MISRLKSLYEKVKKYGLIFSIEYAVDSFIFDFLYGTNTSGKVDIVDFPQNLPNLRNGVGYQAALLSEIRWAHTYLFCNLKNFDEFHFVDIGCGKGRALIRWSQLNIKERCIQHVSGIEYNKDLYDVARVNHAIVFKGSAGNIYFSDATKINYEMFGERLMLFIFNSFDDKIFQIILDNITQSEVYLVYVNPVWGDLVSSCGYELVAKSDRSISTARTNIYKKISI